MKWRFWFAVMLLCILAGPAPAATISWSGSGNNSNFNTGGNWVGGSSPGAGDVASFGDVTNQSVNVNANPTVGSLVFTAPDTYTFSGNTLSIQSGVTQTGGGSVLFTNNLSLLGSQTWNIGTGSVMTVSGNISSNWGYTFTKAGDGLLVLSGSNYLPQGVTVSGGILRLTSNNAMGTSQSWNNSVTSGGTLELSGGINVSQGSLTIGGSGYNGLGALHSINGVNTLSAQIAFSANTSIVADTGSTFVLPGTNWTANGYTLTLDGGGNIILGGFSGGALVVTGSGNRTFSGAIWNSNYATTIQGDGTTYFGSALSTNGLTVSGNGSLIVSGQFQANGQAVVLANTGTNQFLGSNYQIGSLTISNSTNIFSSAVGVTGAVSVTSGGAQTFSSGLTATSLSVAGTGSFYVNGSTELGSSGALSLTNTGTNIFNGHINSGTFTISNSSTTYLTGGDTINVTNGIYVNNGATLVLSKSSTNSVQTAIVLDHATLRLDADEQIQNATGVYVWTKEGAVFNLNNHSDSIDMLQMTGGQVTTGTGTLTISNTGGTNLVTYASSNSSIITGNLAFAGPNPIVQVADGAAAIDLNVDATINATNGFKKTGDGVMKINQTVTSGGPIEINQGTLLLGASNIIANNVQIKLSGGTFATGGFSDTVGNLTLSANSTINMGTGNSIVTFDSATYSGGTLTVTNWNGNADGGGTDQIHFTTAPSATFLANVYWADYGTYGAKMVGNEMVPLSGVPIVPEPGTVAGGLILAGYAGWRLRRRLRAGARVNSDRANGDPPFSPSRH